MEVEIGVDDVMEMFPCDNTLLHHVISSVAIHQNRQKPNRWVNKVTHKLVNVGIMLHITSIHQLQSKIDSNNLNEFLDDHDMPKLHAVTIIGFTHILGTTDFCQGRS
jgi:homoaconitase/3-isopropylmalate dehydratase large subunit